MKSLRGMIVVMLVITLLTGCGAAGDETASSKASTEPLQMLWWSDGAEGDVMQGILDDFKAETGIEIELVTLGYDDYSARLKTMVRGGEAPALIRATEGHITEFNDYLVGLDDAFNADEFTNVYYNSEGEVVTLPMDVTSNGLYVNLDLLDKYDVNYPSLGDEPWTWAEFETEMKKLEGKDDVAYPGVFDNKAHRFMPMVYQFGGQLWDEAYTASGLTSDAAVEALTILQRMNTNGTLDPSVWAVSAKPNELFQTGKYGFHMSGNWFVAAYQDLSFNWGVVPMPVGNGDNATRSTILGGKGICAVEGSGQEEAAKQFIAYLAKGENHDKYTGGVPFLSPRLAADLDFGEYQAVYEVFQNEIANTPVENVEDWQKQVAISGMYPIINQAIEDAMGGEDVESTLQQLANDLMEMAKEQGM